MNELLISLATKLWISTSRRDRILILFTAATPVIWPHISAWIRDRSRLAEVMLLSHDYGGISPTTRFKNETYLSLVAYLQQKKYFSNAMLVCSSTLSQCGNPCFQLSAHREFCVIYESQKIWLSASRASNALNPHEYAIRLRASNIEIIGHFLQHVNTARRLERLGVGVEIRTWSARDLNWRRISAPQKTFNNTFLETATRERLADLLDSFGQNEPAHQTLGVPYKLGFLFYGVRGCGKSSTILAIADQFRADVYRIPPGIRRDEFTMVIDALPPGNVVVIEEIDTYAFSSDRSHGQQFRLAFPEIDPNSEPNDTKRKNPELRADHQSESGSLSLPANDRVALADLLALLDDGHNLHGSIIIFTTNYPERLDASLIRPGRIDHRIEFKPADKALIAHIFAHVYGTDVFGECTILLDRLRADFVIPQADLLNTIILPNFSNPVNAAAELLEWRQN